MSNKKKKSAADDLIESLLEDVNSSSDAPVELESSPDEIAYSSSEEPDPYSTAEEKSEYSATNPDETNHKLSLPHIKLDDEEKNQFEYSQFRGPTYEPQFQSADEIYGAGQRPKFKDEASEAFSIPDAESDPTDDQTVNMMSEESSTEEPLATASEIRTKGDDKTIAAPAFAKKKQMSQEEKVVIGTFKSPVKQGLVHTSVDASLVQAENLKVAQTRILELEKEVEKMRQENEDLAVASQIVRKKTEELSQQVSVLENEKNEIQDSLNEEINLLRSSLQYKDNELSYNRSKVEELDTRLKNDFKKIRVRERELENRLELSRAEKQALVQAKDEIILNLQRKIDQYKSELDAFKHKVSELNRSVESYQDQTKRTLRALRLAMTNMEVKDVSSDEPVGSPLKKAE